MTKHINLPKNYTIRKQKQFPIVGWAAQAYAPFMRS